MIRGSTPRLRGWVLAGIFVAAAGVSAVDYSFLIFDVRRDSILARRRGNHERILHQTHNDPERYRVLVPYVTEGPIRLLSRVMPYEKAFDRVYAVFYLGAITAMFWSLFAYLRRWFADLEALVGPLIVGATLPWSLKEFYLPWSLLEPTFVALALLLTIDNRKVLLGIIIAMASFNRETAGFLVLLYALTMERTRSAVWTAAVYAFIFLAIVGGLRYGAGYAPRYYTMSVLWKENLLPLNLWTSAVGIAVFLGPFWIFAALGWRHAPVFIRRSAWIVPIYALTFAVWGLWYWTRAWMTLYPILLSLALSSLFVPREAPLGAARTLTEQDLARRAAAPA